MPGPEVEKKTAQFVFDERLVSSRPRVPRVLIDQETLAELVEEKRPSWLSTDEAWQYLKELDFETRWFIQSSTVFQVVKGLIAFPFDHESVSTEIGVLSIMTEWREGLDHSLGEEAAQRVVHKLAGMSVGQRLRRDQGYHSAPGTRQSFGKTAHETRFAWQHDHYYHLEVNGFIEQLSELDWWFLTSLHPRLDFEVPWWSEGFGEIGGRIEVRKRAFDPDQFDPEHETEEWNRERKWWLFSCRLGVQEEMPSTIGLEFYPEWLALPPWKQKFLLENPGFWFNYAYVFGRETAAALASFARSGTKGIVHALKPYQGRYTEEWRRAGETTSQWGVLVQRAIIDLENGFAPRRDTFWFLREQLEELWGPEIIEMIEVSDGGLISHFERQRLFEAFLDPVQEAVKKNQEIPWDSAESLPVEMLTRLLWTTYGLHIDLAVKGDQKVERITRLLMIMARETMRPEYLGVEVNSQPYLYLPEVRVGGGYRLDCIAVPWYWAGRKTIQEMLEQTCPEDRTARRVHPHLSDIFEDEEGVDPGANKAKISLVEMKTRFGPQLYTRDLSGSLQTLLTGASACKELGLDQQYDLRFQLIELTAWQRKVIEMTFDELLEFAPQPLELVEAV